jgi:hypothetical protein
MFGATQKATRASLGHLILGRSIMGLYEILSGGKATSDTSCFESQGGLLRGMFLQRWDDFIAEKAQALFGIGA